jgi:hypothetical protein
VTRSKDLTVLCKIDVFVHIEVGGCKLIVYLPSDTQLLSSDVIEKGYNGFHLSDPVSSIDQAFPSSCRSSFPHIFRANLARRPLKPPIPNSVPLSGSSARGW